MPGVGEDPREVVSLFLENVYLKRCFKFPFERNIFWSIYCGVVFDRVLKNGAARNVLENI